MKQYSISVICTDTTTFSNTISAKTKQEAEMYSLGAQSLYTKQGKQIFLAKVKFLKSI